MKRAVNRTHAHLLMLLAILLVATSFPVGAVIAGGLPPAVLMLLRFLLAAAMFAPIVGLKEGFHCPRPTSLLRYLTISVPLVGFFWCMFESLRYTSVLNTGALYTLVPALTAVYAYFLNREKIGRERLVGLLLGTLGALWIVFRGSWQALLTLQLNYGDGVFLVGCLCLGAYNPLVKRLYRDEPMEVMTFWVLLCGSLWLLVLSLDSLQKIVWSAVDPGVYLGLVYLSVFSTLVTFFIVNYCTVRIGATRVAAYGFLTPLFVILLSIVLGLEAFDRSLIPGMLLILGGLVAVQRDAGGPAG